MPARLISSQFMPLNRAFSSSLSHLVPARPGLSHDFRDRVVTAHVLMQGREMSRDTAVSLLCTVTLRSGRPVGTTNVDRRYRPNGDIAS